MARFVVRIELPEKPHGAYGQLHKDMHAEKYFTVVKDSKGNWWHLPHATYIARGTNWNPATIRDEVVNIAKRSHPHPRVYVAEYSSSAWSGLRPVTLKDPAPTYP